MILEAQKIEVTMPIPPTLNEQIRSARGHWSKSAKVKKEWTESCAIAFWGNPPFDGKIWAAFTWKVKNFGRDQDNITAAQKFIWDGIVEAGLIRNDNLTVVQSPVIHQFERGRDEVIVTLSDRPIFELVEVTV